MPAGASGPYLPLADGARYSNGGHSSTMRSSDRQEDDHDGAQGWTDETVDGTQFNPYETFTAEEERVLRRTAALCVQRWYRRQVLKYETFGPMIFTRKDGRLADFGRLTFAVGNRMAQFIRCSDTTSAGTLSHFLEKYWKLRRPDVLISVTGSAASLQLTSQLQRVFDRGLAQAAAMTNAWIFTGGTDSGVMKLVGEAMHKGGLVDVPVVGIAPWMAIHGKSALEGCKGQEVHVGATRREEGVEGRLNPYHTHQILVDAGPATGTWGSEIGLRSRLERTYATQKGVPVVLLVVQGGPNTVDMMLASAQLGCPLLVLSDSGGAASAISQFFEGGIEEVSEPAFVALEPKLKELQSLHMDRGACLISFFKLQDEDSQNNMSSAILGSLFRNLMFHQTGEAVHVGARTPNTAVLSGAHGKARDQLLAASAEVLKRYRDQMQRALLLTVKWNQPLFARRILSDLPPMHDHSRPIRMMLQHALEYRRVEIVRVLLERPGVEVAAANMCQLYLLEDPYNFFRSDASLSLTDTLSQNLSEIARDTTSLAYYQKGYKLFKRLVGPTLMKVSPHLVCAMDSQKVTTCIDLFFWSIFMGDMVLARELWSRVDNPLHCAILAASLLRKLSKVITAGQQDSEAYAEEIEGWAIGVLDEINEQELAHWLLSQRVQEWRLGSLINLALQMELKAFLAHRHCQSLMDLRWRGGYPDSGVVISPTHSLWQMSMWAFVIPFANPYLSKLDPAGVATHRRRKKANRHLQDAAMDDDDDDYVDREDLLLGALAEALALKKFETHNALASLEKETKEMEDAKADAVAAARAESKGKAMSQAREERSQGGASIPAADSEDRLDLKKAPKMGPSAMKKAALAVSATMKAGVPEGVEPHVYTLSQVRLQKMNRQGSNKSFMKRSFDKSTRSLVNKGFKEGSAATTRRKHGFYSVPLIKYLLRAVAHILFLLLYAQVLTHLLTVEQLEVIAPNLPPLTSAEVVLIGWSLTLGYEHHMRELDMRAFGLSTDHTMKTVINTAHSVLAVAIALRLSTVTPGFAYKEVYTAYQMLVSFDAVLMMCELFTFMWTSLNFGVLTITLVQMMVDLGLFVVFFSVVLVGFCLALIGLSETAPQHQLGNGRVLVDGNEHVRDVNDVLRNDFTTRVVPSSETSVELGLVWQPFWAMFAEFDLAELSRIPFGLPLMWVYVLIANVVLVNMLIAMFAETYARIKRNAFVEYRYQHYLHIFEYQYAVHALPPPFNFPLLVWDTCKRMCSSKESRRMLARMNLDDGYDNDPVYGAPPGMERHEGIPLMRKFVQRYLKTAGDHSNANTQEGMARRIERKIGDLEDHFQTELEHLASQLNPAVASMRVEQKLNLIAQAIDRMIKGNSSAASSALVQVTKDKVRGSTARESAQASAKQAGQAVSKALGTPPRALQQKKL